MLRMLRIVPVILVLGAFGFFAAGCGSGHTQMRFVHASPNSPNLDVSVDSASFVTDIAFGQVSPSSGYSSVSSGNRTLQAFVTGTTSNPLISANVSFSGGKQYTVLASGFESNIAPVVITDNNSAPSSGNVNLRFINDSPSGPVSGMDVYVVAPGTDITNVTPNVASLAYQQGSGYQSLTAAQYQIIVTTAGVKTPLIDEIETFSASQVRTFVVLDVPGGGAVAATPLELSDLN